MAGLIARTLLIAASTVLGAPTQQLETRQHHDIEAVEAWDAGAVTEYTIHESCNTTQASQIADGLKETIELAEHAKNHVLRWGNSSEYYQKYFGNSPPYEVIGAYDIIVNGDKEGVIFRCDNPDGNCDIEGWAGHWRGSNATQETVICDLSYIKRRWLNSVCGLGYDVANGATNTFWASDLLHRLYHVTSIGQGYIEHYLETYQELLDDAGKAGSNATHDSDVLQYFALDVYAFDVAVPGVGCDGVYIEPEPEADAAPASATSTASATATEAASVSVDIPPNCHTHEGGELHCE